MTKKQFNGYLFEKFCRMLLEDSGFKILSDDGAKVRHKGSSNIVEMCGRGTWHQIDLPFEFGYPVPFVNPIRIIGEVKNYESTIKKTYIRTFIGVVKDISENYITAHIINQSDLMERTLDQAVFISKTSFQLEAQKLANAHNIKLITMDNNPIIEILFRAFQELVIRFGINNRGYDSSRKKISDNDFSHNQLVTINNTFNTYVKSFFLGTTNTGHLLYFVSSESFDMEEHGENGDINASIIYPTINNTLTGHIELRIYENVFHSTLPKLIMDEFQKEHDERGNAIQAKYHHFSPLTVYKKTESGQIKVYSIRFNQEML